MAQSDDGKVAVTADCRPKIVSMAEKLDIRISVFSDPSLFPEDGIPYRIVSADGADVVAGIATRARRAATVEYVDTISIDERFTDGPHDLLISVLPAGGFYAVPFCVVEPGYLGALPVIADALSERMAAAKAVEESRLDDAIPHLQNVVRDYLRADLFQLAADALIDLSALIDQVGHKPGLRSTFAWLRQSFGLEPLLQKLEPCYKHLSADVAREVVEALGALQDRAGEGEIDRERNAKGFAETLFRTDLQRVPRLTKRLLDDASEVIEVAGIERRQGSDGK